MENDHMKDFFEFSAKFALGAFGIASFVALTGLAAIVGG